MNTIEILSNYLKKCDGKTTDILYEIWNILESSDDSEKIEAFKFFCENQNNIKSDCSIETKRSYFTEKQVSTSIDKMLNKDIQGKIEDLIEIGINNNYQEEHFYKLLWETITKTFKNKRDRALSLFFIIENKLMPYKNLGAGKEMTEEEFQKYIERIGQEKIDEIKYIFDLDLNQKTQTSSLLLKRLLSITDVNEQIVLLSIILEENKENTKREINAFIDMI